MDASEGGEADARGRRGQAKRVLVVDDLFRNRIYAAQLLADLGFRILLAADADDALSILERQSDRLAFVIADASLADMKGIELVREMRRRYPRLPVIVASDDEGLAPTIAEMGMGYLHKPFSAESLSALLGGARK